MKCVDCGDHKTNPICNHRPITPNDIRFSVAYTIREQLPSLVDHPKRRKQLENLRADDLLLRVHPQRDANRRRVRRSDNELRRQDQGRLGRRVRVEPLLALPLGPEVVGQDEGERGDAGDPGGEVDLLPGVEGHFVGFDLVRGPEDDVDRDGEEVLDGAGRKQLEDEPFGEAPADQVARPELDVLPPSNDLSV